MALSLLPFLVPLPTADGVNSSLPSTASSQRRLSLSASVWSSSYRQALYVVMAGKGKRESMDFFLNDAGGGEDQIPDDVVDMDEWMRNRPSGFGVGKEYDLALEEKLLLEIEADKKAREAAKLRAKAGKGKITPKAKSKVTEAPAGVEVFVGNLPRKRKVERDLRAAFRNTAGLLHIRPVVEPENEKTREPVCRGFAFFTFATEDDAYDFVSRYNGEKLKFGKVEKKIACEVAKSDSPWHPKAGGGSRASSAVSVPKLQVRGKLSSQILVTPSGKSVRELDVVTRTSSVTSKSVVERIEEVEDADVEVSETELRAMEEEIWDQFEDDDDKALDLELAAEEESFVEDEDESAHPRSSVNEWPEPVVRTVKDDDEERLSERKVREPLDVDEEDYSVERIRELEAKVREMERKLQLSAQTEEERVELLEKRLLGKARAAPSVSASKKEGEKKKTGAKKKPQAAKKSTNRKIGNLGSASRLKSKERAILTGVLSKYVSSTP